MEIKFLPTAEQELNEAKSSYLAAGIPTGLAFANEANRILEQVRKFPFSGPPKAGYRRCIFLKFPHAIMYEVHEDHIIIIALINTRRDPSYWKSRLRKK